jgi:hypothetical protein
MDYGTGSVHMDSQRRSAKGSPELMLLAALAMRVGRATVDQGGSDLELGVRWFGARRGRADNTNRKHGRNARGGAPYTGPGR